MNETKKIERKILAELDEVERETTDKKILKAVNNIREIISRS